MKTDMLKELGKWLMDVAKYMATAILFLPCSQVSMDGDGTTMPFSYWQLSSHYL